ncbi:MAG: hypothetical protein MJ201_03490 [Mycoplasmoidaceae bacterium]|nr:hypothetical protein [Mycoplasmoidaceae bacterium]
MTNYTKSFSLFEMPNLFSASSLVSNELIKKNNNKFPEGCLEDYYLEHVAIITGFSGLIIPTAPCGQEFDRSLKAAIKRNMRIYD